ncbi:uroporphyrinogen-III C-methyltransferase [Frateuria hangzhouensis]|uniref:uroporphyrinogen-III C-methyltransferase n=1 Tax=Frateuria hangzhouensis TaxID=2995589 RepID=UPI002260B29A|nr:uroporphyrinogen-III C-methyltransferase [Frateuria sp. STR12]MCX7514499.1 uroporphyrinogen-III C-methyltransferase [Frateuria sp. STR12]
MSQDDLASDRPAATPVPAATPAPRPARAPAAAPRRGGTLALALLLALLALGLAGYVAWRQWQQAQGSASDNLDQRVGQLEGTLGTLGDERSSLRQRLGDAEQVNRSLREEMLGQSERLRNLEDAVAKLSEKSLSGHDAMLLDETGTLLRMGQQRYVLFHDAQGAAAAYALADQALAAVNDGAFSGVRQSIAAEREALEQGLPRTRAVDTLQQLRGALETLPLAPRDTSGGQVNPGAWARIGRALGSVVSVQRDNGAPLAMADARFARELAALDLAQAQAALLAADVDAARDAVARAQASLAAQFDTHDPAVAHAQAQLASLAKTLAPATPVQLGAALAELRNLRAVHALRAADATPAPAASTGQRP